MVRRLVVIAVLGLVGCDAVNEVTGTDEVEPNDDPAHATEVEVPGFYGIRGECDGDEEDYFVMEGRADRTCVELWSEEWEEGDEQPFELELIGPDFEAPATFECRYDGLQPTLVANGVGDSEGPMYVHIHCLFAAPSIPSYEGNVSNDSQTDCF